MSQNAGRRRKKAQNKNKKWFDMDLMAWECEIGYLKYSVSNYFFFRTTVLLQYFFILENSYLKSFVTCLQSTCQMCLNVNLVSDKAMY